MMHEPRAGRTAPMAALCAAVLLFGACRMPADSRAQSLGELLDVVSQSTPAHAASADARHWAEVAGRIRSVAAGLPADSRAAAQYHEARCVALSGDRAGAVERLNRLLAQAPRLPEALHLKIQLTQVEGDEANTRRRWELEAEMAALLPISPWSRIRDARMEAQEARRLNLTQSRNPDWPIIPSIDREKLLRIAQLYEDMRLYDQAANAYREAIYGGFAPPEFPEFGRETWISEEAAEAWMSTARCEAAAGRTNWAVHALLMAVAPSPKRELRAKDLLQDILSGRRAVPPPRPEQNRLMEIVNLYCDCNLHPRGLAALAEAGKLPGADVSAQREKLEREWAVLVRSYVVGREQTCFMFGRRVAEVRNPLDLAPASFPYAPP